MEGLFPYTPSSAQEMYLQFSHTIFPQKDYFNSLKAENAIKLMFYIYSLKKTGNFTLGEKILNNLFFAHFLESSNDYAIETCDVCGGGAEIDCENCQDGANVCEDCGGSGEVEHNGEDVTCETCDGDGEIKCDDCGGTGRIECDTCNGYGEVESETDKNYEVTFICSWNKTLQKESEELEDTNIPVPSAQELIRDEDSIILKIIDDSGPIKDEVIPNEFYCIYYSDEPELNFTNDMKIITRFPMRYFLSGYM